MEKTVSYLNSKIWYRTTKVLYILIFFLLLAGYNLFVFSSGLQNVDGSKTRIFCNYKDKVTFTPKEKNIQLDKADFRNGVFNYKNFFEDYNDYVIKDILDNCYDFQNISNLDVFAIQRTYEITGTNDNKKDYEESYLKSEIEKITSGYKSTSEKASFLDFSVELFSIKPVYSYSQFLTYFFVGNASILLLFEVIKRIFYYISLGSIRPKK